jgi:O-antigen ligase
VLLILLPVTSMPLIRSLVGSTVVAAPSVVLLAIVLAGWVVPYLVKGGKLPLQTIPLLAFFCAVILSFAAALWLPIPPLKDINPITHSITAIITLVVGITFFLIPSIMVKGEESFKSTLRWINLGGILILGWSFLQAAVWFGQGHYWNWMRDFQDLLSLGPLYRARVTGFALEPSWLAHQMNMLYLPLWLASTVQRFSAYRFRFVGLTIENLLAAAGSVTLFLSFSRIGWIAFFLSITYLFILGNMKLVKWIFKRLDKQGRLKGRLLAAGVSILLILSYLAAATGVAYVMSRIDPRMKDLFKPNFWQQGTAMVLANQLQFGERVVYWQAGWEVFNRYPVFGVGPGNAGFFFSQTIPSFGWKLIEVRQLMYRAGEIPNSKNLWVRLLAENGIIGLALFLSFAAAILQSCRHLMDNSSSIAKTIGLMGLFVLMGLLVEGFSIDSFALPYYWISFGLVSSAAMMMTEGQFAKIKKKEISANSFRGDM